MAREKLNLFVEMSMKESEKMGFIMEMEFYTKNRKTKLIKESLQKG